MLFAVICRDKPDHLPVRLENREAHLAYGAAFEKIHIAGPMLNDAGDMCGSILILDVADKAAAEAFVADDPYNKAGLFESVEIFGWKQAI